MYGEIAKVYGNEALFQLESTTVEKRTIDSNKLHKLRISRFVLKLLFVAFFPFGRSIAQPVC